MASFVHLTQHSLLPQCLFASLSTVCLHQEEKRMELKPDLKQEVKSVILRDHSMFLRNFNVGSTASSQIGHVEHFILQRAKRFTTNTILPKLVMKHTRVRKSNLKKAAFRSRADFLLLSFFFFSPHQISISTICFPRNSKNWVAERLPEVSQVVLFAHSLEKAEQPRLSPPAESVRGGASRSGRFLLLLLLGTLEL